MSSGKPVKRARRPYSFGDLYDLLAESFPKHRSKQGVSDIERMAREMEIAHETLYRVVRPNEEAGFPEGHIRVPIAVKLLEYSRENHPEAPLHWEDLLPYLLPSYEEFRRPQEDDDEDELLS